MRYQIELRGHDENGDYSESHHQFHTREECINFARANRFYVQRIYDYEDRDYDPVNLMY